MRRAGYYGTSSALAVLFLFPMIWTLYSSVHGRQANNGGDGWGMANYDRLVDYGAGLGSYVLNTTVVALVTVVVTVVGLWAAGDVERRLGKKDPQIVCIDEVAGVFETWLAAPATVWGLVAGVVLFRIFDQWKPWPARAAERLGGGRGVMFDDVVAGAWGAVVLVAARAIGWL